MFLLDSQCPYPVDMQVVVGQGCIGEVAGQMYLTRIKKGDLTGGESRFGIRMVGDGDFTGSYHTETERSVRVFGEVLEVFHVLFELGIDEPLLIS